MPARLRWSSSASLSGRSGSASSRWTASRGVPVRARAGRGRDGRPPSPRRHGPAARPRRGRSRPRSTAASAAPRGPRAGAAATATRAGRGATTPSILRWVCSVWSSPIRVSRCLPRAMVSWTIWPVRSTVASSGTRKSTPVRVVPLSAWSSDRAVRQTVSPSGTDPQPSGAWSRSRRRPAPAATASRCRRGRAAARRRPSPP